MNSIGMTKDHGIYPVAEMQGCLAALSMTCQKRFSLPSEDFLGQGTARRESSSVPPAQSLGDIFLTGEFPCLRLPESFVDVADVPSMGFAGNPKG